MFAWKIILFIELYLKILNNYLRFEITSIFTPLVSIYLSMCHFCSKMNTVVVKDFDIDYIDNYFCNYR